MRKLSAVLLSVCLFSCELQNDEKAVILANYRLKDGATLVLQEKVGGYLGATTPNVIWISRKEKNGEEQLVGKINRSLDNGTISFEAVNDSLINLLYTDSTWHQRSIYAINVNQRIYPNDGSPYLELKLGNR